MNLTVFVYHEMILITTVYDSGDTLCLHLSGLCLSALIHRVQSGGKHLVMLRGGFRV